MHVLHQPRMINACAIERANDGKYPSRKACLQCGLHYFGDLPTTLPTYAFEILVRAMRSVRFRG